MKFLLPYLMLFAFHAYGQCKYDRNEIDPFEKVEVKITKLAKIVHPVVHGPFVWISIGMVDGDYKLFIRYCTSQNPFCLSSDSELLILTTTEKVFRLKHQSSLSCLQYDSSIGKSCETFTFSISYAELVELQTMSLSMLRLYSVGEVIDIDITKFNSVSKKGQSYFIDTVPCILN